MSGKVNGDRIHNQSPSTFPKANEVSPFQKNIKVALPILLVVGAYIGSAVLFGHGVLANNMGQGVAGIAGLGVTTIVALYLKHKNHREEQEGLFMDPLPD